MISAVDYHAKASVWSQDKWKGQFKVKWIYVKDVPNAGTLILLFVWVGKNCKFVIDVIFFVALRHIRLENNENKPVTNSRDTQV